jgi:uncharacterized repeat protein (TIGR02543 family)
MTLLVVMMTVTAARAVTSADGLWEYNLTTGGCYITGYSGSKEKTSITIPKTLDGHTVVSIRNDVFSKYNQLERIYFESDASIENMPSVSNCPGFKAVNVINVDNNNATLYNRLPASIKEIGGEFKGTAITSLTMPGVTSIGLDAFEGCDHLQSVTFHKPATIAEGAFRKIPGNVTVTYWGSIENWNPYCYEYSPNLVVKCDDGSCGWCGDEFGNRDNYTYYEKASCLYWKIDNDGNMTIDCLQQDIILENYLSYQIIKTTNWDKADVKTLSLTHVYKLKGTDRVPGEFENHTNLTSVVINDGLVEIGVATFNYCKSLKSVVLPNSLTLIDSNAFNGCTTLEDIYFEGTGAQWKNVVKYISWNEDVSSSCKEHWRCSVTFDANGHGTAPAAQTNLWSNEAKVTKPADPSAEGWLFLGWYTDAACTTKWDFNSEIPGDMTLYAGWATPCTAIFTASETSIEIPYGQEWTDITVTASSLNLGWFQNEGQSVRIADAVAVTPYISGGTGSKISFVNTTHPGEDLIADRGAGEHSVGSRLSAPITEAGQSATLWVYIPEEVWQSAKPGNYVQDMPFDAVFLCNSVTPAETFNYSLGGNAIVSLRFRVPETYTVTATASPTEGGTVTGGGTYAEGTSITVTATPNGHNEFLNWTDERGHVVSTEASYTFTADGDRTLTANFKCFYPLSGTNVVFFDKDTYAELTEVTEGETVMVREEMMNVPDGYYLTGEFQSDDVELRLDDGSSYYCFTMPAKAVTVTAVTARRTEYVIDLSATTEQVIDDEAYRVLRQMEGYASSECDETTWDCVYYLDLNLDSTPDLQLTENTDDATGITYGVTKLESANQLTENYRLIIPTFSGLNPSRYSSVLVKLVSGSGTHDLPQIILGDVNGDGRVTITDAALLIDYLAHPDNAPAGFVLQAADVDGSGGITLADAVEILKMILE